MRTLHRSHSTLVEFDRGQRQASLDVVEAYETDLRLEAGRSRPSTNGPELTFYGGDR